GEFRLDAGRGHQLFEGLQPGTALASEGNGVRLSGGQTIDQGLGGLGVGPVIPGGHPVVFIDRHWWSTPSTLLLTLGSMSRLCTRGRTRSCGSRGGPPASAACAHVECGTACDSSSNPAGGGPSGPDPIQVRFGSGSGPGQPSGALQP